MSPALEGSGFHSRQVKPTLDGLIVTTSLHSVVGEKGLKRNPWCLFFMAISTIASCTKPLPLSDPTPIIIEMTRMVEVHVPVTVEVTRLNEVAVTREPFIPDPLPPTVIPNPDYSGTYQLNKGENGGCILSVHHEGRLDPFDNLVFELFCNRGPPSYNMGYASDTILFENHVSNMAVWSSPYGECHIVFNFSIIGVSVSQIGQACGFGGGVYADGEYQLKDPTPPELGCLHPNTTVNPCVADP